jgi:hypothetical protein
MNVLANPKGSARRRDLNFWRLEQFTQMFWSKGVVDNFSKPSKNIIPMCPYIRISSHSQCARLPMSGNNNVIIPHKSPTPIKPTHAIKSHGACCSSNQWDPHELNKIAVVFNTHNTIMLRINLWCQGFNHKLVLMNNDADWQLDISIHMQHKCKFRN